MTKWEAVVMAIGIMLIPAGVGIALGARFSRPLAAQWRGHWWVRVLVLTVSWAGPMIFGPGHPLGPVHPWRSHDIISVVANALSAFTGSLAATVLFLRRHDRPAAERKMSALGWAATMATACALIVVTMLPTRDLNLIIMPHVYVWVLAAFVVSLAYGLLGALLVIERDRKGRLVKPATSRIVGWIMIVVGVTLATASVVANFVL